MGHSLIISPTEITWRPTWVIFYSIMQVQLPDKDITFQGKKTSFSISLQILDSLSFSNEVYERGIKLKRGSFIPFSADYPLHHPFHKMQATLASMHISHHSGDHCTTVQLMPTARQSGKKSSQVASFCSKIIR